jgi:hypothetical protein
MEETTRETTSKKTMTLDLSGIDFTNFGDIIDGIIMFARELINQLKALFSAVEIKGYLYEDVE